MACYMLWRGYEKPGAPPRPTQIIIPLGGIHSTVLACDWLLTTQNQEFGIFKSNFD
jgi:hypothetical protein